MTAYLIYVDGDGHATQYDEMIGSEERRMRDLRLWQLTDDAEKDQLELAFQARNAFFAELGPP